MIGIKEQQVIQNFPSGISIMKGSALLCTYLASNFAWLLACAGLKIYWAIRNADGEGILILGACILLRVRDPGDGGFIPSTQLYYRSSLNSIT
jgi:hypothetical protein